MKPAWSWQFEEETLPQIEKLALPEAITKDWAWEGSTGAGVKVAVIDSGVDASHPAVGEVEGAVSLAWDDDLEEVVYTEGPHEDFFGHGTACAAIIKSLAPDAQIYSIRVLGAKLTGKGVVFVAGLRWAIENGMNVVNLSLSTGKRDYFDVFHELADLAYFKNVMLVSAINNVPNPSYPSEYAAVFSVAAHEGKDPLNFDYNPNPPVEFGAPGIDLEVAWQDGGTIEATGNSFAAPHIAGVVARILGKHPKLTPFQMKTVLHALASNAK
ncbi:MAG: hypothetical protein QOH26_1667 [Actinomycetota bacterium]|jgi:subtilisin family serine protease|nr:hypothetical protein [Actinomycetota bacterium]